MILPARVRPRRHARRIGRLISGTRRAAPHEYVGDGCPDSRERDGTGI